METDAELMVAAVAGDAEAFGRLVRRHEKAIYAFLARRSCRADADDLLADVWANAFPSRATFDTTWESALPWLYGIARNVLRRHWSRSHRSSLVDTETADPWSEVDNRLAAATATRQLRAALLALPEEHREILLLTAWEELTPTQAAVVLGIPPSTARSHLRRARRALHDQAVVLTNPDPLN